MIEYYDGLVIIDNVDAILHLLTTLFEKCCIMKRRVGYPNKFKSDLKMMSERIRGMTALFEIISITQKKMEIVAPMFYKNVLTQKIPEDIRKKMKDYEYHYQTFIYPNIVGGFFLFRRVFNTNNKFDKN